MILNSYFLNNFQYTLSLNTDEEVKVKSRASLKSI
jgi:hypothetical protein